MKKILKKKTKTVTSDGQVIGVVGPVLLLSFTKEVPAIRTLVEIKTSGGVVFAEIASIEGTTAKALC
jgi:hypothetical protein